MKCRTKVFQMDVVRPLIVMVNTRRKQSRDARFAAISALSNLTASASLCPQVVELKAVDHIVDLMFNADKAIRQTAGNCLLNLAYSRKASVEKELHQMRILRRLVQLLVSRNLDMQVLSAQIIVPLATKKSIQDIVNAGAMDPKYLPRMARSEWVDVQVAGRQAIKALNRISWVPRSSHNAVSGESHQEVKRLGTIRDVVLSIDHNEEEQEDLRNTVCGGRCCSCWANFILHLRDYRSARASGGSNDGQDIVLLNRNIAHMDHEAVQKARDRRHSAIKKDSKHPVGIGSSSSTSNATSSSPRPNTSSSSSTAATRTSPRPRTQTAGLLTAPSTSSNQNSKKGKPVSRNNSKISVSRSNSVKADTEEDLKAPIQHDAEKSGKKKKKSPASGARQMRTQSATHSLPSSPTSSSVSRVGSQKRSSTPAPTDTNRNGTESNTDTDNSTNTKKKKKKKGGRKGSAPLVPRVALLASSSNSHNEKEKRDSILEEPALSVTSESRSVSRARLDRDLLSNSSQSIPISSSDSGVLNLSWKKPAKN